MSQPAELGPPEIATGAGAPPGTMAISVFDLFKIGIGPSSSHTVGPMRAAAMFVASLESAGLLAKVASVRAELFGSLGATGHGHGSMPAVVLGLRGERPETVDPAATSAVVDGVRESGKLSLGEAAGPASKEIDFDVDEDVVLHRRKRLPFHSNAMVFVAADAHGGELSRRTYYSVGGGFVLDEDQA
ncbi:MAG: serine dehydratase beta chain, partial [Streptosporangiaceae bacterium]